MNAHVSARPRAAIVIGAVIALVLSAIGLSSQPAHAETLAEESTISGVLAGVPAGGANVFALQQDSAGGWSSAASVHVDADGPYTLEGLAAGTYTLQFNTGTYPDQYWELQRTIDSATPIELGASAALAGFDADVSAALWMPDLSVSYPRVVGTPVKVTANWQIQPDTVSYQWYAGETAIAGAATATYTPTADVLGKQLSVRVDGRKAGFVPTWDTAVIGTVDKGTLAPGTVLVTGTGVVGATLTASPGAWAPGTQFAYQWYNSSGNISGATGKTLTLTSSQQGRLVAVLVTATLPGYHPSSARSAGILVQTDGYAAATPTISGTAAVASTLTAKPGTWTTGTAFTYQWYASGTAITGATASTFKLTSAQAGKTVTVLITGKVGGNTRAVTSSAATAKVATTATPTISGTAAVGSTLTAKTGTWTTGTAFTYQWYASGTAITGATASTFKLTSAQAGKPITVAVKGTLSGYATVSKTSAATAKVATIATPTISGTVKVGSTLTAKPGTWTTGTTFTYQWYASGTAITGATASTFTPTTTHKGKTITVKVTGALSGYPTVAKTSAATVPVA